MAFLLTFFRRCSVDVRSLCCVSVRACRERAHKGPLSDAMRKDKTLDPAAWAEKRAFLQPKEEKDPEIAALEYEADNTLRHPMEGAKMLGFGDGGVEEMLDKEGSGEWNDGSDVYDFPLDSDVENGKGKEEEEEEEDSDDEGWPIANADGGRMGDDGRRRSGEGGRGSKGVARGDKGEGRRKGWGLSDSSEVGGGYEEEEGMKESAWGGKRRDRATDKDEEDEDEDDEEANFEHLKPLPLDDVGLTVPRETKKQTSEMGPSDKGVGGGGVEVSYDPEFVRQREAGGKEDDEMMKKIEEVMDGAGNFAEASGGEDVGDVEEEGDGWEEVLDGGEEDEEPEFDDVGEESTSVGQWVSRNSQVAKVYAGGRMEDKRTVSTESEEEDVLQAAERERKRKEREWKEMRKVVGDDKQDDSDQDAR